MDAIVMEVAGLLGSGGVALAMLIGLAAKLVISGFQMTRLKGR